jgi:predicted RND superfamily exporter protein
MSDTKIDIISKDLEFVKDIVQDVGNRVSSLESGQAEQSKLMADHFATDQQMYKELHRMNNILEENTQSLIKHMQRSELNELAVQELKKMNENFEKRLVPIEHKNIERAGVLKFWKALVYTLGGLASLASAIYTVLHLLGKIP